MNTFVVVIYRDGAWEEVHRYRSSRSDGAWANYHMCRRDGYPVVIWMDNGIYFQSDDAKAIRLEEVS